MKRVFHFTRRVFVASFSGVLILIASIVVFWLLGGNLVADRLSREVNRSLFTDRTTRLSVGRVTGSVLTGVTFENVRLERRFQGDLVSFVEARRVEATYDPWELLRGRAELHSVHIVSPLIEIAQDSTGRWVLPVGNAPGDRGRARIKRVKFDDVQVTNARLRLNGIRRGWEADELAAQASLDVEGDRVAAVLRTASFVMLDPVGRVESLTGNVTVDGARVEARGLELRWEGSRLTGDFKVDPADSLNGFTARAFFEEFPLGRLRGFVEGPAVPASGLARGSARVSGGLGRFGFEADLSGRYADRRVDTLSVAGFRDGPAIDVSRLRLVMPECDLESGSGRLDLAGGGRITAGLEFRHLQVDSIPLKAVRWIEGAARGRVDLELASFRRGRGPIHADVRVDLTGREVFGVALAGVTGRVRYTAGADVIIEDALLTLPDGGLISGGGLVHPGDVLDIDFTAETGDWSQLRPVIAIPGLSGSGRATGRLIGTGGRPELDIGGEFRDVTGWQMRAASVHLARITGPFVKDAEFEGTVEADSLASLGRIIDHVEMDYHWIEPRLTFSRLDAVDNDTTVATSGHADFDVPRNRMTATLSGGTLSIGELTWTPQGPVVVDGRGTDYDVRPQRFTSRAGSTIVEAGFRSAEGLMDSRFTEMNIDLAVMAGSRRPPEFHGGTLTGDLRLEGLIIRPDPSGRMMFTNYRWDQAVVDSALFEFAARDRRMVLREGWADAGAGRLRFHGRADLPDHAWIVWSAWRDSLPIAWERTVLDSVVVSGSGVDIPRWAAWNPDFPSIEGSGSGRAVLSGPVGAPRIGFNTRFRDLRHESYRADSVDVAGRYAPDQLVLDRLAVFRDETRMRVSGEAPVALSLWPFKSEVRKDQPVRLLVDLPRADLTLLPLLVPALEKTDGELSGRLRIDGTPERYTVAGQLSLKDGGIRIRDREETVENLAAELEFDGTTVRLNTLTGTSGATGKITGSGTFELGSTPDKAYRIDIDVQDFILRHSAEYAARLGGHFEIVPLKLSDGTVAPMTVGNILVSRAEIVRELDQPQAVPEPGDVYYYSLTIDAPRGIFILNDDVDMELAGTLTARRTPDRSELIGELDILRGTYTLLLKRFRITEGKLTFNRLDVIDPTIDITAETNDAEYIISVHITGEASNPVLKFDARKPRENESAGLSEEEILKRLVPGGVLADQGFGDSAGPGTGGLGVNVLTGSVQLLLAEVQRDIARRIGVDEIRIDSPGAEDQGSYGKVSVSKWVTPEVSVRYSQGLSGYQEQDLSVEYRLGRLLFLRGEIIRRRTLEEEYNIDLRFWHEY